MKIELSQDEVETLHSALECWEKEAGSSAMMTSILGAIITSGTATEEKSKQRSEESFKKADEEGKRRRIKSTLLRAKLLQANIEKLTS